eukprot:PhM_4_TR16198/c0_g1_i1/m.68848
MSGDGGGDDDDASCCVCLEPFEMDPAMLPCGHIVCTDCLAHLARPQLHRRSDVVVCPWCRAEVPRLAAASVEEGPAMSGAGLRHTIVSGYMERIRALRAVAEEMSRLDSEVSQNQAQLDAVDTQLSASQQHRLQEKAVLQIRRNDAEEHMHRLQAELDSVRNAAHDVADTAKREREEHATRESEDGASAIEFERLAVASRSPPSQLPALRLPKLMSESENLLKSVATSTSSEDAMGITRQRRFVRCVLYTIHWRVRASFDVVSNGNMSSVPLRKVVTRTASSSSDAATAADGIDEDGDDVTGAQRSPLNVATKRRKLWNGLQMSTTNWRFERYTTRRNSLLKEPQKHKKEKVNSSKEHTFTYLASQEVIARTGLARQVLERFAEAYTFPSGADTVGTTTTRRVGDEPAGVPYHPSPYDRLSVDTIFFSEVWPKLHRSIEEETWMLINVDKVVAADVRACYDEITFRTVWVPMEFGLGTRKGKLRVACGEGGVACGEGVAELVLGIAESRKL